MSLFSLSISQLVLAFISASILQRFSYHRFFLKWLLSHNLVCYLTPTDDDLKKLRGSHRAQPSPPKGSPPKKGHKGSKKGGKRHTPKDSPSPRPGFGAGTPDDFKIHNSDLGLLKLKEKVLTMDDMDSILYSEDLEWLAGLAAMSLFGYMFTEVQFCLQPHVKELNLSLVWGLVIIFFSLRLLFSFTLGYLFSSAGERSVCGVSLTTYTVVAILFLFSSEDNFEFGLEDSYKAFCDWVSSVLYAHEDPSTTTTTTSTTQSTPLRAQRKPVSLFMVKMILAMMSSMTGMFLTFPGLRYGQMHRTLMDKKDISVWKKFIYFFNYISACFVVLLWYKPLARDVITRQTYFPIDDASFETLRLYTIIIIALFRFTYLPQYLAAYLMCAPKKVESLRAKGGTMAGRQLQLGISSMITFFNVVSMQYIIPIFLVVFNSLVLMSLCGYNWMPPSLSPLFSGKVHHNATGDATITTTAAPLVKDEDSIETAADILYHHMAAIIADLKLQSGQGISKADIFKGPFQYATWWLHFSWFANTTLGILYNTYLVR